MVDYENCHFQPVSGTLEGAGSIRVRLNIQTGNRTTTTAGSRFIGGRIKLYSKWLNGENGESVFDIAIIGSSRLGDNPNLQTISLTCVIPITDLKKFNGIDYAETNSFRIDDTFSFNRYSYLIQTEPQLWGNRDSSQIGTNSSFTSELTLQEDASFTAEINSSYTKSAYEIYITAITNVANFGGILFPYTLPLRIDTFDFTGIIEDPDNVRFELQAGRISDRDPDIILNPTVVGEIATPTIPNNPTQSIFSPIILSVEKNANDELVCNYIINPTPVAQTFTSMTLRQRRISTPITQFEISVTNNYQTRSLTGQEVNEGESVRIQLVMLDHNRIKSESVFQDYTLVDGEFTLNQDFYEQQSIRSTKIHVTKVRHDTIDLLLINDRFNDEFVSSVTASVLDSNPPIQETIPNNLMSSNIELTLAGLPVDTAQTIIISAIAKDISFEIQRIGIKTTISISDNPSDDLKKMQSMQRIIHMAYDNDSIEDIEGLGVDEMGNITRDVLMNLQEPSNLGVVYDRNRSNRKGSVYNKGESDTVRHNYPKTLEQILATNPIDIPSVSEGYN